MRQYHYFMHRVNEWEKSLVDEGIDLIKIYLSVPRKPRPSLQASHHQRSAVLEVFPHRSHGRRTLEPVDIFQGPNVRRFFHGPRSVDYNRLRHKQQALLNAIHCILQRFGYEESGLIHPALQESALESAEAQDLLVDGVLFTGLNQEQVAILDRIRIHE